MKNYYDIEELKRIRISEVLKDYGITLNKHGFFSIRNERTASCKYYEKTNSFYDFGSGKGGNVINLVGYLEQCSGTEAMEKLASLYHIEPVNKNGQSGKRKIQLTDSQYALLGIAADKATKNMSFDLDLDFDELKRISDKYMIPMNSLKEKYLPVYETIIATVAVDEIDRKRAAYRDNLHNDYVFRCLMKTIENLPISSIPAGGEIMRKFKQAEEELNRMEKVMAIACQGCKAIAFVPVTHDAIKEYSEMVSGIDLSQLRQILDDNPIWFDAFDYDKSKAALGDNRERDDYSGFCESAARQIMTMIESDRSNHELLPGHSAARQVQIAEK